MTSDGGLHPFERLTGQNNHILTETFSKSQHIPRGDARGPPETSVAFFGTTSSRRPVTSTGSTKWWSNPARGGAAPGRRLLVADGLLIDDQLFESKSHGPARRKVER